MADNGWIKLHRKMLDWEWYSDINTTRLFIHLLLTVNVKDYEWRGVHVHRGSRITSLATLSNETALSDRQVRTALDHLISTNEITKQTTNQYTLISIVNYDSYQSERPTERPTERQGERQGERQAARQSNDQRSDKPDNSQERRKMAACDDGYEVNDKQSVNQTTSETTNEATSQRQAARQSNDKRNDQRSDKRNDQRSDKPDNSQERRKMAACDDGELPQRQAKRPTERQGERQAARQSNDEPSDNNIRREEDKNIDAAITRARASERESFCQKIENAFGKLTGKLINGADARTIFALYEQCTDANLVIKAMEKSAAKFNPKYIGDKIQSFNYFVPAINDAIHDTGRRSHGDTGRSNGQAAVGSSAFTGEVRNGTPSGFSSD